MESLKAFMKERARELHDLLVRLVKNGSVSAVDRMNNTGGIVVAGWSYGTSWMSALLANIKAFPAVDFKLSNYIRRVVFLGTDQSAFSLIHIFGKGLTLL